MATNIERILRGVRLDELPLEPPPEVSSDTTLDAALAALERNDRGAVLVRDGDRSAGIFTERDVLYRVAGRSVDPATPIRELMTPKPRVVADDATFAETIALMTRGGFRQLPVVGADGTIRGLVTSRDLLDFIADHYSEEVLNLPPRLHQRLRPEGA